MHNNDIQQNAAMDMRVSVRERAILLWQMTLLDDQIKRDALYQRFYAHGSAFLKARAQLLDTDLTPQELEVIDRLNYEAATRTSELKSFAEKLMTSNHSSTAMLNTALSDQIIVANLLDKLIEMQRTQNEHYREQSSQAQTQLFGRVLIYMVIIVVAGFVFAGYVIFTSAKQRRLLEAANTELQHVATHDHLTGLPNRVYLTHQIERVMSSVKRKNSVAAVLFIDLDNFKPVNDQHGHEMGDRCLTLLAARIKDNVRGSDMAGRLGGDEFVVVLSELDKADQAEIVAQKLINKLSETVWIDDKELHLSASIGISLITRDTRSAEAALTAADKAMYIAKETGKNQLCVFDAQ
ncbi:GGDEF domain-containing protein [Pontibacterium granulatum]|uniref:GGDEF domain-containing protein n=1 Tax=Pontibacterium granulatum TaxID=2036029 RepID=UPI00249B6644|nr:GGDEF domain-containing protein [Pontibacterium granulatum]MDI3324760.1 GGDEF domain-containing protein [Pontibacterium granulatum]